MTWLLTFLEEIVPVGSVVLSVIAAAVAAFTAWQTKRRVTEVREKIDRVRKSRVVEDHAELPGFSESADDVDDRS